MQDVMAPRKRWSIDPEFACAKTRPVAEVDNPWRLHTLRIMPTQKKYPSYFPEPMKSSRHAEPLTKSERKCLGDFLKRCQGGKAMNLEELDGFSAALVAGPELVMPSEYYPEVFGGEMSEVCEFSSLGEAQEILGLVTRQWNAIAATLNSREVYAPILLEDESGMTHGNDWAHGFMREMEMRHDGWAELVNDSDYRGCLVPMLMLYHEWDDDPETRTNPISSKQRGQVIVHMAAGLLQAYWYFRQPRQAVTASGKGIPS